jgi:translocation and assembly module TamB
LKARTVLRRCAIAVGATLLSVLAVVAGALGYANTPPGQRLVLSKVNAALGSSFRGTIAVCRVGTIGPFGVTGVDATIDDPAGRRVLSVHGVSVHVATLAAVRSALFGRSGPIALDLSTVAVESLEVNLDRDQDGKLELLDALASRHPSTSRGRGVRLAVPQIALGHARASGPQGGGPPLDVDVDDLRAALTVAPDFVDGDISQAKITARGIAGGADVVGALQGHVAKASAEEFPHDARVVWDGALGPIAHSARASLAHGAVEAVVDVPDTRPESIRSVWPASSIDRPARLHLEAHGTLPRVELALHAAVGQASLVATGPVSLAEERTAKLTLRAEDVDIREFAASAPRSRLGLTGTVSLDATTEGALSGDAALRFLGGSVGTSALPRASIHATLSRSATKQLRSNAEVILDEPDAPTRLTVQLFPRGEPSAIDFQFESMADDLQRVPELPHGVSGRVQASAAGEIDIARKTIEAQLQARVAAFVRGTTRVQSGAVEARAHGPLDAPEVDVGVQARGLSAGAWHVRSADVRAVGAATAPHVTVLARGPDIPDVDAAVDVALGHGLSLRGLRVVLAQAGERAFVTVRDATMQGPDVTVNDARIEGLGAPVTATVTIARGAKRVVARTGGVDLARLARLAGMKRLQGGTVALDTDLTWLGTAGRGHLLLNAFHVNAGSAMDATAHVELSLDGRSAVAKMHADVPGVASLDVDAPELTFGPAGARTAPNWMDTSGVVDLDARADASRLAALLPADFLPLDEASGKVALKAHVARQGGGDRTPDVHLTVSTEKLVLSPRVPTERDIDGVRVHPLPAWRMAGIDFAIEGGVDGAAGRLQMSATARDAKGALAQLDATSEHFPYQDFFRDSAGLRRDLRKTEFNVNVSVPERGLGGLPAILQQRFVTGRLQARLSAAGTLEDPTVNLTAALRHADLSGNAVAGPVDVDAQLHYDGRRGTGSVKARSRDKELVDIEARIDGALAPALAPMVDDRGPPPWTASARAHMAGFPLQAIVALDDKRVAGSLSGDVSLADWHKDAHVDANLSIEGLSVGHVDYRSAKVVVKADGHTLDGSVRLDQSDGFAEAKVQGAETWGATLAPSLDPTQPLQASLSSKNMRVAAVLPFVDGLLDELDGRLDADAHVELGSGAKPAKMTGNLTFTGGTVEAAAGGGELHDVTANVKLAPDGTVTLEKLSAAGLTGKLEASGTAKLQGLALQSAHVAITIPGGSAIPVTAGGSPIGDVDGRIDVTASAQPGRPMQVKVEVPQMEVKVPEASTGHPQGLDRMKNVRIGAHRGDPAQFVLLRLDPTKKRRKKTGTTDQPPEGGGITIATHLVDVHVVRGTQLKVDLGGDVNVGAGTDAPVTGQIELKKGGTLDVRGRSFSIEHGVITFLGDPSNPQVVVKARYNAPDGTVVYATFSGPLKTGKVTLTSEPRLPKEEIVQLLLFGSTDGKQAQGPSNSAENTALAAAGGEAAQPLNHMLNQLGLGAVTAKVDTSSGSGNAKPEIEVQIGKQISLQIAVVLGQPPPGVNPDHTLFTLDWRFKSKWSVATTVGDAGTTIFDLLWQRRY